MIDHDAGVLLLLLLAYGLPFEQIAGALENRYEPLTASAVPPDVQLDSDP